MSLLIDAVGSIIDIKVKRREDGITDQYNRVIMCKMCIILAAVVGCNYFSDMVDCIVDGNAAEALAGNAFVGATCWIQGFYIYAELKTRLSESAYYGLPRNMDYDGLNKNGVLCSTTDRASDAISTCIPMTKVYYLQYQYMPFLLSAFAMFFYLPYLVFKATNTDLLCLKETMKEDSVSADAIIEGYFDYNKNTKRSMRYRVLMNIFIKVLYLLSNLFAFYSIDALIHGDYSNYGAKMISWSQLTNSQAHDHSLKIRATAKPGNVLLPPMGYCEISEASRDVRNTRINYHKLLCEISPHVLYQYVLLLLWFLLIVGIVLSVIGLGIAISSHLLNFVCFLNTRDHSRGIYRRLTTREVDYLEYIRRKNMPVYNEVLKKIKEARWGGEEKEASTYSL